MSKHNKISVSKKDKWLQEQKYYYENGALITVGYRNKYGERHREDGPAVVHYYKNGRVQCEIYCIKGNQHRVGKPAWIHYSYSGLLSCEEYWLNGKRHKIDGPALINYEKGKVARRRYYINGEEATEQQIRYMKYSKQFDKEVEEVLSGL